MTISVPQSDLDSIKIEDYFLNLYCRDQINIHGVHINDTVCEYEHNDRLSKLEFDTHPTTYPHQIYNHDTFRRNYTNSYLTPELSIDVRNQLALLIEENKSLEQAVEDRLDEIMFILTVRFSSNTLIPEEDRNGYKFTSDGFFYTSDARLWFPCLDSSVVNPNNRCTWEIEIIVPALTHQSQDVLVISTGDLIQQVVHPHDSSKKICYYYLQHPTCAHSIALAAGPFQMQQLPGFTSACRGWAFCPPNYELLMDHSISFITKAFEYMSQYIGASFPFSSFKLVFLPEPLPAVIMPFCTMTILSTRHLHDASVIDETFDSRIELARTIALQWFGQYIFPKTWADTWLIVGIANYLVGLFVKKHFGNNEYKFRLKKDMEKCFEVDVDQTPLYLANAGDVTILDDFYSEPLVQLKSPLVIYMLEKFLGKNMIQKILNKMIVSAISGEMTSGLSTNHFLKQVKKISGKEPKPFADQWIYKSGTPKLTATYVLNRKKNMIELKVTQDPEKPIYVGNLTVRVHEPDGTFDHVVAVEEAVHNFELLYHTKYKRQRQNKKTMLLAMKQEQERLERERAEGLLPPPGCEADEYLNQTDPEVAMEIAKADWKEVDEDGNEINVPISWIRLDPDLDIACPIEFTQFDYMDAQQLAKDKDPIAQYEAVKRMATHSNLRVAATLFRCLMDVRTYYRVRMEAAVSLARGFTKPETGAAGLYYLFLALRKKYCVQNTLTSDHQQLVPKRNNFKSFTEYFLQKSIPEALSTIRDVYGRVPVTVLRLLLTLLKLNDNAGNAYSDHAYVSSLIDALGKALLPPKNQRVILPPHNEEDEKIRKEILETTVAELNRFLFLETQVPSYRNSVALVSLRVLLEFSLGNLIQIQLKPFLLFSRFGNFEDVRKSAIDGLILLGLDKREIIDSLHAILKSDPSPIIREFTARRLHAVLIFLERRRKKLREEKKAKNAEKGENRTINVSVEDLSAGVEQNVIENRRRVSALEELDSFWDKIALRPEIMDTFHQLLTKTLVYDDRTRRAVLSLVECLYDQSEYEVAAPPPEVPKLKLLIKTKTDEPDSIVEVTDTVESTPSQPLTLKLTFKPPVPAEPKIESLGQPDYVPSPLSTSVTTAEQENSTAMEVDVVSTAADVAEPNVSEQTIPIAEVKVVESVAEVKVEDKPSTPIIVPKLKISLGKLQPSAPVGFDKAKASRVLFNLMTQQYSYFFNQPVDPIRDGVPNYYSIVTEPMDFGTVKERLDADQYANNQAAFEHDVELVFGNCYKFNPPKTLVYQTAKDLEKIWKKEWLGISSSRKKIKK